jgi:hypothetical protein
MALYITGALLVFGFSLHAFVKDISTSKADRLSWGVLIIATVFWPLVLPSMVRKKFFKPSPIALETQLS